MQKQNTFVQCGTGYIKYLTQQPYEFQISKSKNASAIYASTKLPFKRRKFITGYKSSCQNAAFSNRSNLS